MVNEAGLLLPQSEGALLTEEWSINPLSTLPSFLEMKLVEEASRSGRLGVEAVLAVLVQRLEAYSQTSTTLTGHESFLSRIKNRLRNAAHILGSMLRRYSTEAVLISLYLLERRVLRVSSATLAESMYGLKRVKLNARGLLSDLTTKDQTRAALALCVLSYLGIKTNRWGNTLSHRKLKTLVKGLLYAGHGANVLSQWCFLTGKSYHFDLPSRLLGHVVRRVTQQDLPATAHKFASAASRESRVALVAVAAGTVGFSWLTLALATFSNEKRRLSRNEAHIPAPHRFLSRTPRKSCPLCSRCPCIELTAMPSGWVACGACIRAHLQSSQSCPISGQALAHEDLVKLFDAS